LRNEKIATLDYTVIVEGMTDYIAASLWACKQQCTKNETVAILGITSGSINALSKINWPDGKKVIIATDNDDAGNSYAKKIRKAIPENIELMRTNYKPSNDVADRLKSNENPFEETIPLKPEELEKQYDLITLADMKPTKTKWMIDGMIPDESCVIVGAEEKSGKTWLMFYIALCVISGRKMFDRFQVGKNGKVIIYSPESGWNAKSQRMWGLCWGMELDPQKTLTSAIFIKGKLDLSESECIESLKKDVARIKPAIIMLDPLICLHNGIDENASGEIQKLLNSIREISQCQPGMSVLVAHHLNKGHQGKSNFHGLRGSSAIGAWADGRISITRQPGGTNPIRRIDIEHRDAPSPLPIGFRIEERQCQISHDGLPAFYLEPYEVDIEKNTRLNKIVLEQVLHVVVSCRGITRYEGAAKVGISRSKFNRYFDYLKNQGKVRLDELDRMYPT
jgi:5S rRNA maturation endonuclease (ribonuclease M5)